MDSTDTLAAWKYLIDHLPVIFFGLVTGIISLMGYLRGRKNGIETQKVKRETRRARQQAEHTAKEVRRSADVVADKVLTAVNQTKDDLRENTDLTHAGIEQAKFAFKEGNDLNTKLASVNSNIEAMRLDFHKHTLLDQEMATINNKRLDNIELAILSANKTTDVVRRPAPMDKAPVGDHE